MIDLERRNLEYIAELEKRALTGDTSKPYGGRLESWEYIYGKSVGGYLYDDPNKRWEDGTYVTTSTIESIDKENSKVYTRNTVYALGKSLSDAVKEALNDNS